MLFRSRKEPVRDETGLENAEEKAQEITPVVQTTEETPIKEQPRISPAPSLLLVTPHQSDFAQMEAFLLLQLEKCTFYKSLFEKQDNTTMANKFETMLNLTTNDLEIVRSSWRDRGELPRYAFEIVKMICIPSNVDVKEKEMLITVKISSLPVAVDAMVYAVAEFEFPLSGKEETIGESLGRWSKSVKIEPKRLVNCCSEADSRQLDMIFSTDVKPFYATDSKQMQFDRAARFYIEKGKSRTLKRKFKPVKLTFYEKTNLLRCDNKLGTVQVRVDGINDNATVVHRLPIMNGRKQTEAYTDIRVRVREPLVDKSLKNHGEKMLILT